MRPGRYFGDRRFYRTALSVALPIMIQNGITNFVSMLDNIMVGRVGTTQMTGVSIANTLLFVFNLAVFGAVSGEEEGLSCVGQLRRYASGELSADQL